MLTFKKLVVLVLLAVSPYILVAQKKNKVLVFSATKGFRHTSIETGKLAVMQLGEEHRFSVDTTEDAAFFTEKTLKKYKAVIFLSTTMNVLNETQQTAFEQYIQAGGGFVGIHAATDTEYDWPWYNKLVGAQFASHPKQQNAVLQVIDSTFIATKHLPKQWKRWDEWYNFKNYNWKEVKILLTIDESTYEGGKNDGFHPMAWYHYYDGGRAFYTALGHTEASFSEPEFLQHLLGGIQFAMGKRKKASRK